MSESLRSRIGALLRWSEQYVKTDMIYAAKGGFWVAFNQIGYLPIAFALSLAFANLLPKDVYGTYRFILSVAAIIGVFAFTGIDTAIPQAVARGYEGMLRKGMRTYLAWSWVIYLATAITAGYYFLHGNQTLGYGILVAGLCLPILSGANLYSEFLQGRKEFKMASLFSVGQSFILALAMAATMLITKSIVALVAVYYIGNTFVALALYRAVLRNYHPNADIDPESMRFGYHTSATNVIGTIADQLDKLLVFHLFGAPELAVYSFATAMPEYLRGSTKMFSTLAIPKFATRERATVRETFLYKMLWLMIALGAVAVVYIIVAPYLFRLLYPQYLASVPFSQVYALIIIAGAAVIPGAAMNAQRAVREQYILALSDNFVKIGLLVGLSLAYGLWGIVAARLLGRSFTLFVSAFLARNMT